MKQHPDDPPDDVRDPSEEDVMELAERWSVNPQLLDKVLTTPTVGTVATLRIE